MLKLSTRSRYAVRAMIELALHEGGPPLQLRLVAIAQGISPKYLEQLAVALRRGGLVEAERGPHGGYRLARPASGIAARDIVEAVDGPIDILDCVHDPVACERAAGCAARELWQQVDDAINGVLAGTTLSDLRERHFAAQGAAAAGYEI